MEALDHACRVLLASLSASLGRDGVDSLDKFHDKSDTSESGLKFIDEPTLTRIADVGDNLHTDGGTFTVIFCERFGLQAFFPSSNQWGFIPPQEGCCVVNVADALSRFSDGTLHSPKHRVTQVEDGTGERFYLSYFLRPSHKYVSK
jgi:isopenicillin N synthase-like dioxygenase